MKRASEFLGWVYPALKDRAMTRLRRGKPCEHGFGIGLRGIGLCPSKARSARLGGTGLSAGHYCAGGLVMAVGLVNAGLVQRLGVWVGVD